MLETMENTTNNMNSTNLLAELVEARVALAKSEMQLEWQKLKDHSKPEPEVMAPLFEALAKAQAEFESVTATSRVTTLLHESGVSYDIESVPVFYNVNDIKNLGAHVT